MDWTPPPLPPASGADEQPRRNRRGLITATALIGGGVVAGAIIGATALSSAATSSSNPSPSASSSGSTSGSTTNDTEHGHGGGDLNLSGTVTTVGTSSVTIKTTSGTTTYAVSTSSDIDKNGEASLSALKAGDAVTFNVTTSGTTSTIDKLHAGSEALDRPQDPAGGNDNSTAGG